MSPMAGIRLHRRGINKPQWTPGQLPGLDLWLNAEDLVGADGSLVASWTDRVLATTIFSQSDDTKKPVLRTSLAGHLVGGRPAVHFDGLDDGLVYQSTDRWITRNLGHLFMIGKNHSTTSSATRTIFSSSSETASPTRYMIFRAPRDLFRMAIQQRNGDTGDAVRGDSIWAGGSAGSGGPDYFAEWASDGSAYSMRLNNHVEAKSVFGGADTGDWFSDTPVRYNVGLGCFVTTTPANSFFGDIAELILMSSTITADDRENLNNYVRNRYGIALAA